MVSTRFFKASQLVQKLKEIGLKDLSLKPKIEKFEAKKS